MIAIDTNVIIAALMSWQEFHGRARAALDKALLQKRLLLPLPALVESYSVLTRMPSPYRLSPTVAHQLLHDTLGDVRIAALPSRKAWQFLGACEASGTAGGRTYDALIATIAIEAGATEILTFNPRHFESFSDRIQITIP
jgi:predicted nucleic acid-binding protein